jgi:sugar O-acyltransferase (sialic acid O-acetyltransferase NeuD family)
MEIKELILLGFSEATITMVLDILETNNNYPTIKVINNLKQTPIKSFENPKFNIELLEEYKYDLKDKILLGVTKKENKIKIFEKYNFLSLLNYTQLISKTSIISTTTTLGRGTIINPLVCIAGHTYIDNFVFINRNVSIGHHTSIGEFSTINPGVNIAGNVKIGRNCQIGMGCNIFDGVEVGNNVTIGGGSVVTKNIPDNVIAYGSPCKIIRNII